VGGRARRDTSAVSVVDRRDAAPSPGQEEDLGLREIRRDLGDERDLDLRDLDADNDLGRRSAEVRDVDYDYIFGNSANDDDDLVIITIIIIITMAFVVRLLHNKHRLSYHRNKKNSSPTVIQEYRQQRAWVPKRNRVTLRSILKNVYYILYLFIIFSNMFYLLNYHILLLLINILIKLKNRLALAEAPRIAFWGDKRRKMFFAYVNSSKVGRCRCKIYIFVPHFSFFYLFCIDF